MSRHYRAGWLPNPDAAVFILRLATEIALVVHLGVGRLARRLMVRRYSTVLSVFTQMRGLTRSTVLVLAIVIAVPVALNGAELARWLSRLLLVAMIGLIGWNAITDLHIVADL